MDKERKHIDEYEMDQILERSFDDVPNKSISATAPPAENVKSDFMDSSQKFWLHHEGGVNFQAYKEGELSGTYNTRMANFKNVSETLIEAVRNIIRIQCEAEDKTANDFSLYMDSLENAFKLLTQKLNSELGEIDGEAMMAYLHAVINSFVFF